MTKKEGAILEKENMNKDAGVKKTIYSINEVAVILDVHQQTLRNWERKKVVVPLRVGARRVYTQEHLELCKKIKEFSGKGVSLKGIKEILNKI